MSAASRQCALALHSLGQEDREWLLGQLPAPRIEQLRPMLAELSMLGIPADPALVREALHDARDAKDARADSAADLPRVLIGEPDRLVAHVLAKRTAAHREIALQGFPADRRDAVLKTLHDVSGAAFGGPALARFIEAELSRRTIRRETSAPVRWTTRLRAAFAGVAEAVL